MSFREGNLHERVEELERDLALAKLAASDDFKPRCDVCDRTTMLVDIEGLEQRVAELESLVLDMWETMEADTYAYDYEERLMVRKRVAALGLLDGDAE